MDFNYRKPLSHRSLFDQLSTEIFSFWFLCSVIFQLKKIALQEFASVFGLPSPLPVDLSNDASFILLKGVWHDCKLTIKCIPMYIFFFVPEVILLQWLCADAFKLHGMKNTRWFPIKEGKESSLTAKRRMQTALMATFQLLRDTLLPIWRGGIKNPEKKCLQ